MATLNNLAADVAAERVYAWFAVNSAHDYQNGVSMSDMCYRKFQAAE